MFGMNFYLQLTFVHDDAKKPIATILFAFQSRFENNYGFVNASAMMMDGTNCHLIYVFSKKIYCWINKWGFERVLNEIR